MTAASWRERIKTDRVHRTGFCQRGHWLDDTQDKYGRCRRCERDKKRALRAEEKDDPNEGLYPQMDGRPGDWG